jgi:deoxycytidylate deaminase
MNSIQAALTNLAIHVERTAGAKIAAAVVKRNRIVGIGINSYKTHPMQKLYTDHPDKIYLHAEVAAIQDALRRLNNHWWSWDTKDLLVGYSLYVVRVKQSKAGWTYGLAKPCKVCQPHIENVGIQTVKFTTEGYNLL